MTDKPNDKDKKTTSAMKDVDAIDKLSLAAIPLSSNTLKSAKLVKNSRMETSIELYKDPISGSLQIHPEDIVDQLATTEQDEKIIRQLSELNSYDVYSLRASLKKLGLEVTDPSTLSLSDDMKEQLNSYTAAFTRPLVERIFGDGSKIEPPLGNEGLLKILRDPDVARVRRNLTTMTQRTGIPLDEIPKFLSDYSDTFLSIAYYRFSFDNVGKEVDRFLVWAHELRSHRDAMSSAQTMASCKKVEDTLRFTSASVRERLGVCLNGFELFWADINKDTFNNLRNQIESNHSSLGSVLCGLVVKMSLWSKEFPDNTVGGPQKRAKFVVSELEPGIEKLKNIEIEARTKLGLSVPKG